MALQEDPVVDSLPPHHLEAQIAVSDDVAVHVADVRLDGHGDRGRDDVEGVHAEAAVVGPDCLVDDVLQRVELVFASSPAVGQLRSLDVLVVDRVEAVDDRLDVAQLVRGGVGSTDCASPGASTTFDHHH